MRNCSAFSGPFAKLGSLLCLWVLLQGCGKSDVDRALDSDANGYVCLNCNSRFYTDRDVFASRCPDCKQPNIEQVLGYVCKDDNQTNLDARGRGARKCSKCSKLTSAVSIPREADLKAWGAKKRTAEEVGG